MAAYILTSVLNYAFSVGLSWYFTPVEYGVLGVAQSLLLLTALAVGSGFAWTANHDLAAGGLNDHTRRRFRTALLFNSLMGAALALGLWALYAGGLLPLGPAYRFVLPLVGLTTALLAARAVLNGAARGLHAFTPVALNLTGEVLVKLVIGLWLAALGAGAAGVLVGFSAGAALSLVHSLWVLRRARLFQDAGRLAEWLEAGVLPATLPLFTGMLGVAFMLNLDVLGLKLLAPAGQGDVLAGYYQAAVTLARTPVFLAQALTLVLFSYAARLGSDGAEPSGAPPPAGDAAPDRFSEYQRLVFRVWGRLLVPGGLALFIAPGAALGLFFPLRYQQGAAALQAASLGGVLLALVTLLNGVLQARSAGGSRGRAAWAAAAAVAAQVLVLVWLVPSRGALGAAYSLVAAGLVDLLLLAPWLAGAWRGRPAVGLARAATGLLASYAALALPLLWIPDTSRSLALLQFVLAGLAYLGLLSLSSLKLRAPAVKPVELAARPDFSARQAGAAALAFARVLFGG